MPSIDPNRRPRPLTVGSTGKRVLKLEQRLKLLGFAPGKVDGKFDTDTFDAVKRFKAEHPRQFRSETGNIADAGLKVLEKQVEALQHAPYRGRAKPSGEHKRLDKLTAEAARATRTDELTLETLRGVGLGDKGRAVLNIQKRLEAAGFSPGKADGRFDERTEAMIELFQRKSGLEPTGRVDGQTWGKLSSRIIFAKGPTTPAQAVGERSGAVKATEKRLRDLGYKNVKVDGIYDKATARAVKDLQKDNLLRANGKVDKRTARVLKVEAEIDDNKKLELVRDIAIMAKKYGVPAELPIITALVESDFRNVHFGDRDSLGMFQQRAAWGPASVRLNPLKSAKMFLLGGQGGQPGAVDYIKRYRHMGPRAYGAWAQAVQVSAFPDRYQTRIAEARRLLEAAGVKFGLKKE